MNFQGSFEPRTAYDAMKKNKAFLTQRCSKTTNRQLYLISPAQTICTEGDGPDLHLNRPGQAERSTEVRRHTTSLQRLLVMLASSPTCSKTLENNFSLKGNHEYTFPCLYSVQLIYYLSSFSLKVMILSFCSYDVIASVMNKTEVIVQ